jgi:hypothetical protein
VPGDDVVARRVVAAVAVLDAKHVGQAGDVVAPGHGYAEEWWGRRDAPLQRGRNAGGSLFALLVAVVQDIHRHEQRAGLDGDTEQAAPLFLGSGARRVTATAGAQGPDAALPDHLHLHRQVSQWLSTSVCDRS